jgi:hypothetical protein
MCTIASRISSWASASGLPVSLCTSSASRPRYLVRCDFQARRRRCRPFQPSSAHRAPAALARATAASTSAAPSTGKLAITSEVAGFTVSKVAAGRACVLPEVVVTIALTYRHARV